MIKLKIISAADEGYGLYHTCGLEHGVNAFCQDHNVISIVPMSINTSRGINDIQVFITYQE